MNDSPRTAPRQRGHDRLGRRRFLGSVSATALAAGLAGCSGGGGSLDGVEVAPDPVPGRTVTLTATRDGDPIEGVRIWVNGDHAGETNADGRLDVTVPYTDAMVVTGQKDGYELERVYDLPTAVDLEVVDGDPVPGETLALRATIEGVPVADAAVAVDGEEVAETDADGRVEFTVPYATSFAVTVTRAATTSEREFDGLPVDVEVSLLDGPVVPGTTVTVEATLDGDPVPGATVLLGERDGDDQSDDENGSDDGGDESGDEGRGNGGGRGNGEGDDDEDRDDEGEGDDDEDRDDEGEGDGEVVAETDERGRAEVPVGYVSTLVVTVVRNEATGSAEFDVPTDIAIGPDGPLTAGEDVTLTAAIEGVAVPDATVTVDGEAVGQTTDSGALVYTVPQDTDALSVSTTRGAASGSKTYEVAGSDSSPGNGGSDPENGGEDGGGPDGETGGEPDGETG